MSRENGSAVLIAAVLVVLTGCSSAIRSADPVVESRSAEVAIADSLGTARYTSVSVAGDAAATAATQRTTFQVWFDWSAGHLQMVADGPVNAYSVPVEISASTITPDPERMSGTAVGCTIDDRPDCYLDHWISELLTEPLTASLDGADLRLSRGSVDVLLRRDTGDGSETRVGGRTLLTYAATDGGDQALLRGVLGENAAHCVTVGRQVVIVPDTAKLLPDGSLVVGGAELRVGKTVSLGGGGSGQVPSGSPCAEPKGRYFTVGGYAQPQ